ncbi:MAG: sigma-54 dependent transcriptional regulator [Desulfobacterales bacterium]|nr:sigma-54 dependent transcriptional regulator [Desulfobacterales bacterium]
MSSSILVVDDERDFLDSVRRGLITSGIKNVRTEEDPRKAAAAFEEGEEFDIALIDVTMPDMNGIELLEVIKSTSPATECIMVTAVDEARVAIDCLKKGAYDYLVKPISKEDLVSAINRALERRRLIEILDLRKSTTLPRLINEKAFKPILTRTPDVMRVLKEAELHAASNIPILITGETGTGKELLARAVHAASPRAGNAFTPINMESLNPQLFESQFFGHTKGAFTGAREDRVGYLESTHRGTLFMDEIGNLPFELQGKLLRVLQDGEFIKIGTAKPRKVDVRFIAATNSDLDRMIVTKQFRKDLYYRLKGGWLHLPPLRERHADLPLLMGKFLEEYCGSHGTNIEEDAVSLLLNFDYPGNIRELRSIVQSSVNMAQGRPISPKHLPENLRKRRSKSKTANPATADTIPTFDQVGKNHILSVYDQMDRNKSRTARALGIGLNTLRRKLESYGVN